MGFLGGILTALAYIGVLAGIIARAKALYPGKPIRTLIVVEDPGRPLGVDQAQQLLNGTGAAVIPGFTVTP